MVSFFVFWGTILFHIWPPALYWPAEEDIRRTINMTRSHFLLEILIIFDSFCRNVTLH